ncbi:MAG: hypothetical protein Ta2B_00660 [Termitinemataceae bacterium]|nr:MAG: hypothetical protein Ta2B_00660 [Termitinemataceae bacterium]
MAAGKFIKTLIYRAVNVELDLSGAPGCAQLKRSRLAPSSPEIYAEAFFAVVIRGDLAVNETKLAGLLKASEVTLAADADVVRITGAPVGFAGPVGLNTVPLIADPTVTAMEGEQISLAVCGALANGKHYQNVAYGRDWVPFWWAMFARLLPETAVLSAAQTAKLACSTRKKAMSLVTFLN